MKIHDKKFYGVVTVGEKGQVVIPVTARKGMGVKKGEKLLVLGIGKDTVIMSKLSNLERIASHLAERLKTIRGVMNKTGKK